jgi:uncharacterized protein (TIGR03435 family)
MRCWVLPLFALTLTAQTPSFEVASLRPAKSPGTPTLPLCGNLNLNPESVIGTDSLLHSGVHALAALIESAYYDEVDDFDFPDWTRGLRSLVAVGVKIPPDTTRRSCRKMLQNLLAERFHMVTGVETREVFRYYVKVAKPGLKLKSVAPPAEPNAGYTLNIQNGVQHFVLRGAPASRVFSVVRAATLLNALSDQPRIAAVIDETGLTGYYDGEFQLPSPLASNRKQDFLPETLGDALERQVGLTLELRKAPGKVLFVRSSDRTPSEN